MRKENTEFALPPLRISPPSAIEHVYSELKNALMSGEFSPGQPMRLEELAVAFGTSHMPIRESLNRLSGLGVLERVPRRSIRVPNITVDGLRSLLNVRILVERQAVIWATERCANRKLDHLHEINNNLGQVGLKTQSGKKEYLRLNRLFHFYIYNMCENEVLTNTIEMLWLRAGPVLSVSRKDNALHPGHDNHCDIIDQMEKGRGAAAADALERDIVEWHEEIFAILEASRPQAG